MRSGLYALASRDGRPLDLADRDVLHLPGGGDADPHFACAGLDLPDSAAIQIRHTPGRVEALAGYLDEPDDLANTLGCPRDTPHVVMMGLALDRNAAAAPSRLMGDWTFLRWNAAERTLTLMASEHCRDPIYYTIADGRVAVAPDLRVLGELPAVGRKLDREGVLLNMGRARVRAGMTDETFVAGVKRVLQGTVVTISPDGVTATTQLPTPTPARWRGSFDDAIAEIEHLLLRIVGQTLERHRRPAFQLSGGLDSSLLGYLGSRTLAPGQSMRFFCSAAPPGSGLKDESSFAALVAEKLGVPMDLVVPPREASIYRPSLRFLASSAGPVSTISPYLHDALFDAAIADGADLIMDGVYGEATISYPAGFTTRARIIRKFGRMMFDRMIGREVPPDDRPLEESDLFHAKVAPSVLGALPPLLVDIRSRPFDPMAFEHSRGPNDLFGRARLVSKSALQPTEAVDQRLRSAVPFRDRRLIDLVAGMPTSIIERDGLRRAPARALLRGHVPDTIIERVVGLPFSPDLDVRFETQAQAARERIALFRAAAIDEWLDLDWLTVSLDEVIAGQRKVLREQFQMALTASAAEYLLWWQTH